MLYFQLFLQLGQQKNDARDSSLGIVMRLRGVAPVQEVGKDEGRMARGIFMVDLDVSLMSPLARDMSIQSLEHN